MKKIVKWVLIIFVVLFVLLIGIASCSDPSTDESSATSESTAEMTPQEIDLEMYRPVRSAQASYEKIQTMMVQLDTGETSLAELYDYCKQVKDWGLDWSNTIDSVTTDDSAEYAEAAGYYVKGVAYGVASNLMKYIDENDYDSYSGAKDAMSLLPMYESEIDTARKAYLSAAGLSEEEIQQQIDLG